MTPSVKPDLPASIVAFGNLANKSAERSIHEFAALVAPDRKWTGLDEIFRDVVPEKFAFDWATPSLVDRSEKYRLNAWLKFAPVFHEIRAGKHDLRQAQNLMRFAGRWMAHWVSQHKFSPDDPAGGRLENKFAWYDMGVGLRAALLSQILSGDGASILEECDLNWLRRGVEDHIASLEMPETWASHSNHGFFQSAGLFALARQAEKYVQRANMMRGLAAERILHYLEKAVSSDGVHLEHSPEYHGFIFTALCEISPLLDDAFEVEATIGKCAKGMQEAFGAMILPNHLVTAFGDGRYTKAEAALPRDQAAIARLSPHLQSLLTANDREVNYENFTVFKRGGLAAYKRYTEEASSYLGVSSWHHSSVHKQVDDHSFIWAEDNIVILSDAGRYGYEGKTDDRSALRSRGFFYGAKERIFVESAHAHNTVEINDESDNRRQAAPYQSGIVAYGELEAGFRFVELEIIREPLVRHGRFFLYLPGNLLLVLDDMERLIASEKSTCSSKLTSWHQYFPAWDLSLDNKQVTARYNPDWCTDYFGRGRELSAGRKVYDSMRPIKPYLVRSQTVAASPGVGVQEIISKTYCGDIDTKTGRRHGWASLWPKMLKPSGAVGHEYVGEAREVSFATLFQLVRGEPERSDTISQLNIGIDGRSRHVSWSLNGQTQSVALNRDLTTLTIKLNENDPVISKRACVDKNKYAQALYQARAARQNGMKATEVAPYYNVAIMGGNVETIKEALEYASDVDDEDLSKRVLEVAHKSGSGQVLLELAKHYMENTTKTLGDGALEILLMRAVKKNVRAAYYHLGELYLDHGRHLYSPEKARQAFVSGVNRGHEPCRRRLAESDSLLGHHFEAVSAFEALWAEGELNVGKLLLEYYGDASNTYGFMDMAKALKVHVGLAEGGSKVSAYQAGRLAMQFGQPYYDLALARRMLGLAVERNSAIAAYYLVGLLDKNESDYKVKARTLLEMAATARIKDAEAKLEELR